MKKLVMKKILFISLVLLSFKTNAQSFTVDDSLFYRYANLHDKLFLEVSVKNFVNGVSVNWIGDCGEIRIESNNDQYFPVINCINSHDLHLHNLSPGLYTLKFYFDDKLMKNHKNLKRNFHI